MGYARTVSGDIRPDELGIVLAHEHVICAISSNQTIREEEVVNDLSEYVQDGGCTVVELTNTGMGQDAEALQRLSQRTGVQIIACTGFYRQPWYPPWIKEVSVDTLRDFMEREIETGINGTGVRAGVIGEIGTSQEEITPLEARVVQAAAEAAYRTGAPLSTHTSFGAFGLEQLDLIAKTDLPLSRVSIGHLDLRPDPEYHAAVADRGAYIQYDTFGKEQYMADARRIHCLLEMARRGYERQILLSNDISQASYLRARGGWGYCHLLGSVVPQLRAHGLSEQSIDAMLRANPARFLAFVSDNEGKAGEQEQEG